MAVDFDDEVTKSFTGMVDAIRTAALGFRVSGEFSVVNVNEGQIVWESAKILRRDRFKAVSVGAQLLRLFYPAGHYLAGGDRD
jgi:hypothetical protein